VLLIACASVASVLLARAPGGRGEIAVRLSVGATRGRLIQQLTTRKPADRAGRRPGGPSLLAWWSFSGLLAWVLVAAGHAPPLRIDAQPSLNVLWFALAVSVTTALLFGLVPRSRPRSRDVQTALKRWACPVSAHRLWMAARRAHRCQVAVCMVLLVSAEAAPAGPACGPDGRAGLRVSQRGRRGVRPAQPSYDDQRVIAFQQRVLERVRSLPGVDAVALTSKVPLSPGHRQTLFRLPGQEQRYEVDVNTVSPEYFSLIAIPIVRGRTFTASEREDTSPAVIVTEATARRYWPGQDPIGRTVVMEGQETPAEVVGVAKDAQVSVVGETVSSYMYLPAGPGPARRLGFLVRSRGDFASIAAGVRNVSRELDPGLVARVDPPRRTSTSGGPCRAWWRASPVHSACCAGACSRPSASTVSPTW
jgi:hypothetical protein